MSLPTWWPGAPDWSQAKINLAIATLNRQQPGDLAEAETLIGQVLVGDPENLQALYCQALLKSWGSAPGDSLALFERVAQADPHDAYAAYHVGRSLFEEGKYAEALEWYRTAHRSRSLPAQRLLRQLPDAAASKEAGRSGRDAANLRASEDQPAGAFDRAEVHSHGAQGRRLNRRPGRSAGSQTRGWPRLCPAAPAGGRPVARCRGRGRGRSGVGRAERDRLRSRWRRPPGHLRRRRPARRRRQRERHLAGRWRGLGCGGGSSAGGSDGRARRCGAITTTTA